MTEIAESDSHACINNITLCGSQYGLLFLTAAKLMRTELYSNPALEITL